MDNTLPDEDDNSNSISCSTAVSTAATTTTTTAATTATTTSSSSSTPVTRMIGVDGPASAGGGGGGAMCSGPHLNNKSNNNNSNAATNNNSNSSSSSSNNSSDNCSNDEPPSSTPATSISATSLSVMSANSSVVVNSTSGGNTGNGGGSTGVSGGGGGGGNFSSSSFVAVPATTGSGATASGSVIGLNPLNRADAVRRQSIEVVQLAKSDVEELHAKLKSLQEVLTKGEREKLQLEAQIGALKAQAALKQSSGSPAGGGLEVASVDLPADADQLLDSLLALLQQKGSKGSSSEKATEEGDQTQLQQGQENDVTDVARQPAVGEKTDGGDSGLDSAAGTPQTGFSVHPGFTNKLALLFALCSPSVNNSIRPVTTATNTVSNKKSDPMEMAERNGLTNLEGGDESVVAGHGVVAMDCSSIENSPRNSTAANNNSNDGDNNGDEERHMAVHAASSSVEQCSAITNRFQEKINQQQDTIERLNNALEEVELILEESHAKNASLQEKITRLEQEADLPRKEQTNSPVKSDLTSEQRRSQAEQVDNGHGAEETTTTTPTDCPRPSRDRDLTKEPSSSTDVTTSSSGETSQACTEDIVAKLRIELEGAINEKAASARREAELTERCADFIHQIENLTSQLTELTSQAGSSGITGGAGFASKLEELQRENQNLMLELSEVQHALNRLSCENERLRAANASVCDEKVAELEEQKSCQELTVSLEAAEAAKAQATSEVDALRRELENAKAETAQAIQKLDEETRKIEQDRESIKGEAAAMQETMALERQRLAEATSRLEDDQEALRNARQKLEEEQDTLKADESRLAEERQTLQKERESFSEEMAKVKADAETVDEELRARCKSLTSELEESASRAATLETELSKKRAELEQALQEGRSLEASRSETEKTVAQLEAKLEEMEAELATLKNQQSMEPPSLEVEMLLEELKADLAASRSALDVQSGELSKRNERVAELEESLAEAGAKLKSEQDRVTERQTQLDELRSQLQEQTGKLDAANQQLVCANDQTTQLEARLTEIDKERAQAQERIELLQSQIESLNEETKLLQGQAEKDSLKAKECQDQIDQLNEELKKRLEEINTMQAALDRERARADDNDEELSRLQEQLEGHSATEKAHNSLQEELAETTARLEASEARVIVAEAAQDDTRAKLHHATEENSRIMQELKAMEEEKTSLHVDLVKCRQQLCEMTQIRSTLEKLRTENADLRSSIENARAEVERSRSDAAEQRSTVERITTELSKLRQEAATAASAASRDKEALMSEIAALSEKHLKVNSDLETVRAERTGKAELAAQLGNQLAAVLSKAKEGALERENLERQIAALRNELAGKVGVNDKLTKDLRAAAAHADNLKKQVSKLLVAVAEKEKHLAALHSDNQKLRGENQAYCDKLAGQDALINRIALLEQDIASRNMTISKVCAEREDGVRQLEQLRARHAVTLREAQEIQELRNADAQMAVRKAAEGAAEHASLTEQLSKLGEQLDQLKKSHDIALSERTIAESRCRSTLNLSRKLEREVTTLQRDKERMAAELGEAQQHIAYLEGERTELLKSFKDLPEKMQKLQTENGILRNEVEKLRDREHAWAPLVAAGLARGRKVANAAAKPTGINVGLTSAPSAGESSAAPSAAVAATAVTPTPTAVVATAATSTTAAGSAPQPKKKTIFARLKDGFEKAPGGDQSPVKTKIAAFEEKVAASAETGSVHPAPVAVAATPTSPMGSLGQRRRGVRRSASEAELGNAASVAKRASADSSQKDTTNTTAPEKEQATDGGAVAGGGGGASGTSGRKEVTVKAIAVAATPAGQQQQATSRAAKGRGKMSSSTEEDDEEEQVHATGSPAPMVSRRRSQQGAAGPGKAPTPPKGRSPLTPSAVKSRSNATGSGTQRMRATADKGATSSTKDAATIHAAGGKMSASSTVAKTAAADRERQSPTKGRRSLIKGTPKKTPGGTVLLDRGGGAPASDGQGSGDVASGGRSLRASTLVVKKASDMDAKQREQIKHRVRTSTGALSTDV